MDTGVKNVGLSVTSAPLTEDQLSTIPEPTKNKEIDDLKNQGTEQEHKRSSTTFKLSEGSRPTRQLNLEIEGVEKVTLSKMTQEVLGCIINEHITKELPWKFVCKLTVQENVKISQEFSFTMPMIEDLPGEELLIVLDTRNPNKNQFLVCVTKKAENDVLHLFSTIKKKQFSDIKNSIRRKSRAWTSMGSEIYVGQTIVQNSRPLFEIEAETTVGQLRTMAQLGDSEVQRAQVGPPRYSQMNVERRRINTATQAVMEMVESEAQTDPGLPKSAWSQYTFEVAIPTDDEDDRNVTRQVGEFTRTVTDEMDKNLASNSMFDLLKNDYETLAVDSKDLKPPEKPSFEEFLAFIEVSLCKGKRISSVSWHPIRAGVVAISYVNNVRGSYKNEQHVYGDGALEAVFSRNIVLVWTFNDAVRPKLVLETFREVHCLRFCPTNDNILIGGCINGQIILWDLSNKLDTHEEVVHRAYHPALVSRNGLISLVENDKGDTLQFITTANDGLVQFWDLNSTIPEEEEIEPTTKPKNCHRIRPLALETHVSPFEKLNRKFQPHFKLKCTFKGKESKKLLVPVTSMLFQTSANLNREGSQSTVHSQMQGLINETDESADVKKSQMKIYLGTLTGAFVLATWEAIDEHSELSDHKINAEGLKYLQWEHCHDGPVHTIECSPFFDDIILSIGGSIFAVWLESERKEPILMRKSEEILTSGTWSNYCPNIFFLTREDGTLEVWDLLCCTTRPVETQSLSGKCIREMTSHKLPLLHNVIGIADHNGSFRTFCLPECYQIVDPDVLEKTRLFFDHEMQCRRQRHNWVNDWKKRNENLIQKMQQNKQAKKKKQKEEQARKEKAKAVMNKLSSQNKLSSVQKRSRIQVWEERSKLKLQKERERQITQALVTKKKVRLAELERQISPLTDLKQERDLLHNKMEEARKEDDRGFRKAVDKIFASVNVEETSGHTSYEYSSEKFDQFDELFDTQYREMRAAFVNGTPQRARTGDLTWKSVLINAQERHYILDPSLGRGYLKPFDDQKTKEEIEEQNTGAEPSQVCGGKNLLEECSEKPIKSEEETSIEDLDVLMARSEKIKELELKFQEALTVKIDLEKTCATE